MSPAHRAAATLLAATVVNLPFGTLYAFGVFLKPMEAPLGATRAEMGFVFGLATVTHAHGGRERRAAGLPAALTGDARARPLQQGPQGSFMHSIQGFTQLSYLWPFDRLRTAITTPMAARRGRRQREVK